LKENLLSGHWQSYCRMKGEDEYVLKMFSEVI